MTLLEIRTNILFVVQALGLSPTAYSNPQGSRMNSESSLAARTEDLRHLGASAEALAAHADSLDELELVLTIWPGERKYTMADVAQQVGVPVKDIIDIRVSCGFAEPEPSVAVATDGDVEFYRSIVAARDLFGEAELLQLLRVIGAALAKVADAATSAFLINIDTPGAKSPEDPSEPDSSAKQTIDSSAKQTINMVSELVPELTEVVDTLLRKHLVAARRTKASDTKGAYEIRQLAVGFADLIGSTQLAERLPFARIGQLLATFEETTSSIITRHGGRVIKLIGDEVLFAASEPTMAAKIGFAISEAVAQVAELPGVRVGIAAGEVLTRDGDVFGPPVNRAARIVKQAAPGTVLVTPVIRAAADEDFTFTLSGKVELPGFSTPTELWQLEQPRGDVGAQPDREEIE